MRPTVTHRPRLSWSYRRTHYALRTQIAEKFVTLGILPRVRAVVGDFLCPAVLVLKSGLQTVDQVRQVLARSNVVVATAQVLAACSEEARSYLA